MIKEAELSFITTTVPGHSYGVKTVRR